MYVALGCGARLPPGQPVSKMHKLSKVIIFFIQENLSKLLGISEEGNK